MTNWVQKFLDGAAYYMVNSSPCIHDWAVLRSGEYKCRCCDIEINRNVYEKLMEDRNG